MPSKVPSDLINQSQIGFREVVGLSSFNPQHPTLKSLPTVQNSISAVDSSPSRFRCKHCEEKLLRGSQSLICIYCGQCQAKDPPPEPIFFNSTTGYHWLLQSLNLNDSEMIEPLVEEKRRNKVGTPVEGVKALSEFLDVQIKWPNELEIPETSYVNKMLDHSNSSNDNTIVWDNFERTDSGSDASEEHAVSSKDDQGDGFEDQDNLSLFQIDDPKTAAMSSDLSRDRDAEIHPRAQVEDSKANASVSFDLSRNSSFGDDTETQSVSFRKQNEDSETTAAKSSDLRRNSSSENEEEIESVNSRAQIEDSKANASVSFDLSRNSSFGDDTEIQSVNFRDQNDDSKTSAAMSSDLRRNSSSENEEEIQSLNSRGQIEDSKTSAAMSSDLRRNSSSENEEEIQSMSSKTTAAMSSDLRRSSSSENEEEIESVNSRGQNEDSKTASVSFDLSGKDSSGDEAEIQHVNSMEQNEDSKANSGDLRRDSSSGDDTEIQSMSSRRQNEDSITADISGDEAAVNSRAQNEDFEATANLSSDLRRDSSSGDDDTEIQSVNSRAQNEEDFKATTAGMASDLNRDSSSGDDDTEIQSMNSSRQNEDSKTASASFDLRGDDSSEHDAEIQPVNSRAQNEDHSKPTSANSSRDSSFGDDTEIQSVNHNPEFQPVNSRAQNEEDSKATSAMSSDLKRDSSSGDDTEIQSVNYDSKTAVISSNLSDDDSSGHHAETQPVNSRTQNEDDSKATADMASDLNKDSSSGDDDAEIQLMNSMRQNEDSKTATISSNLSDHSSFENDTRAQNEDYSKATDLIRDSSSADDNLRLQDDDSRTSAIPSNLSDDVAEIHQLNSRAQNEDHSKATDLSRNSSSGDEKHITHDKDSRHDAEIQSMNSSRIIYEHDAEMESLNSSRRWNQDSRSQSHDLSGDGSSGDDDIDFQSGHSGWNDDSKASTVKSSDFRSDFSSGDNVEVEIQSGNNSKSLPHIDSQVLNTENLNHPSSISDDKIQENQPIHKD